MNKTKYRGLSLMCGLVVLTGVMLHSAAWGGCTVQERLELGKQGHDKGEVERICAEAAKNDSENFWEALTKDVVTNFSKGLTDGLSKGLDKGVSSALGARERNATAAAPAPREARECVTYAGNCPLSGVPTGARCYCQAWDGTTFYGVSR